MIEKHGKEFASMAELRRFEAQSKPSTPKEQPTKKWERLIDMPTDVLASRVVSTLIMAKGNLNEYDAIIKKLLDSIAEEHRQTQSESRDNAAEVSKWKGIANHESHMVQVYKDKLESLQSASGAIDQLARAAGWVGVSEPLRYLERYIARNEKLAGRKVMVDGLGNAYNVPDDGRDR